MTLNTNSRLVQFAYALAEEKTVYTPQGFILKFSKIPERTTLCRFFWRAFVFMPLLCLVGAVWVGTLLAMLAFLIHAQPYKFFIVAVTISSVIGVFFLLKALIQTKWSEISLTLDTVRNSTFGQGVKTLKGKFCPIITFEED